MAKETIADLARRLGISKAAVSYALNGQPGVSEQTRRRVLDLAGELEWYASSSARALSRSRAGAVGVVLSADPLLVGTEPFHMAMLAGIEAALADADMSLMLRMVGTDPAQERATYERWAGERKVDGVLVFDYLRDDPRPALLKGLGLPFVLNGAPRAEQSATFSGTTTDHASDAAMIVDHLRERGHRRVAHLSGPSVFLHEELRIAGVRDRAVGHGIEVVQLQGNYALHSGHAAMVSLLQSGANARVSAVIFGNDLMAMGGLLALREAGMRCPEDIAMISWDDSLHCQLASPPVTALSRNPGLQGQVVAKLLLSLLDSGETRTTSLPPSELLVRASTYGGAASR